MIHPKLRGWRGGNITKGSRSLFVNGLPGKQEKQEKLYKQLMVHTCIHTPFELEWKKIRPERFQPIFNSAQGLINLVQLVMLPMF
jgi:hypothetical protein